MSYEEEIMSKDKCPNIFFAPNGGYRVYRRLHLPVNALPQNMFSSDVKRLSFRCQTLKFSHPNVKFYFSILLKGKMFLINNF